MIKVLFAASECWPFVKTGGLADVAYALPLALTQAGLDVRVVMPAYRGLLSKLSDAREIQTLDIRGQTFRVIEGGLAGTPLRVWMLDCPALYDRDGNPYQDPRGVDFSDNAWRFGCFGEAIHGLALGAAGWKPDVVHANDWQTGLALAWLSTDTSRPRTIFTIHNLAYQGHYGRDAFNALGLPPHLWSIDGVEMHGGLSFMKAGINGADLITTVSPNYAREIQTPAYGYGLEGLLTAKSSRLLGIVNGVDAEAWDPSTDANLARRFSVSSLTQGKNANKRALQNEMGLSEDVDVPLVGVVTRLAYQKGTDLILGALDELMHGPIQFAFLAAGDRAQEQALHAAAAKYPGRVGVQTRYDERLAHRIEAGADLFLMPSRFEPCGLNQMYSQRYGTVPVVRRTGGLVDTVIDANDDTLKAGTATGVCFDHADVGGVIWGVRRALHLRSDKETWRTMQLNGMRTDFSWARAAQEYVEIYRQGG